MIKQLTTAPARALSLALLSALPPAAQAQAQDARATFEFAKAPGRLPKNVVPREYTVSITPDAAKLTIAGTESIVLDFASADATIQFNSLNQKLSNVRFDGKPVRAVTSDDAAQLTTVTLAAPAAAGRHTLSFAYTGRIQQDPHGLFRQQYVTPSGVKGAMLSTHFQPAGARRMFPCWDEPAFRAAFKLSVTVPAKWAVYSNMPAAGRRVKGALATTSFAPTPPMPSYLAEFSGGHLAHIAAERGGVKFRVVAVKGQEEGGRQALADAQDILAGYTDYFGVRYPLPKLDSIAIPGGFTGAMENWGAITYNDQFLLQTPSSTMGDRQTAYSIQAHEIAHQWFGNLVTMGWWDELWLNESFASWMGSRQTDRRHPDWHWWEQQDEAKENAMGADATANSHPLLQHVTNEIEADAALDPEITYLKGQSVLRMLEAYLGEDVFRDGMRRYMAAHAYGNTFSGDLWRALDGAGGAKVGAMAASWTSQPGFPLVSVAASCDAGGARTIALSQTRFITPLAERLGWTARADEMPGERKLRRILLGNLGRWGDQQVIAEARRRFAAFVADRRALGEDDQSMVLGIVARNATAAEFDQLHAIARAHRDETELARYYTALMQVRDPALGVRAAAIAMSDEIPAQAARLRLELVGYLSAAQPQLAWTAFSGNVEKVLAPFQPSGPQILAQFGPAVFWRTMPLDQLEAWLTARVPAELAPRLARSMERARFQLRETAALARQADAYLDDAAAPAR